ncbi:hypothetical protein OSB04_un001494 [Centaurea solstitialis]|uniref:F-box domain-containing protein n=1 Tax=Centaurea solstitialis TaxID=347529 RepID=A0AA38S3Y9_9ASTR|nr:hypothetical protein OSB04_un001494 [Centaurea solstitialis]
MLFSWEKMEANGNHGDEKQNINPSMMMDILLRLPVKTIIFCKLVCKKWQNLVSNSSFVNLDVSISVYHPQLTIDILSRLPIKTIIHCKLVCKKWRNLVFYSSFVNIHISRSPTGLVIQQNFKYGSLKWVEIDEKVDHHLIVPILQNSVIDLMGSINDDVYICNLATGEIISAIVYSFGVCSLTGEYKVVQTFQGEIELEDYSAVEAEVYTLGTGQWRCLGRAPHWLNGSNLSYGTFRNDHCHWIVYDKEDVPEKICTFDLHKETFQLFPSPPSKVIEESCSYFQNLVVRNDCLCKSYAYDHQLTIWIMKKYGIKKSWHKEVVITKAISRGLN